ncbi:MAG TPA: AIR synthase-related protein, partial [Hyphomicrobiaceae bacterium]|nr:AIR synthase-related protein [Hyphomicrobiaceae bacterium]
AQERLDWTSPAPFDRSRTLAEALLEPTRIYVKPVLAAIRAGEGVKAVAHITGGGLSENLPRILPAGLGAHVDLGAWTMPPVFGWLQRAAAIDDAEMLRTFNCGIGLVLVIAKEAADAVAAQLRQQGEHPVVIGAVEPGRGVKSQAKGKGEAEAVQYSGRLTSEA